VERVVELTVPEEQLAAKTAEAEQLPQLEVTSLDLQWLQVRNLTLLIGCADDTRGAAAASKTAEAEQLPQLEVTSLDLQWLQVRI
jgi:hypothetical protein